MRCLMRACVPSSMISSRLPASPASPAQPNPPQVPAQIPHSQGRSPRPCRPKSLPPPAPDEPHHTLPSLDSSLAAPNHSGALRCHLGLFLGSHAAASSPPGTRAPCSCIRGPSPVNRRGSDRHERRRIIRCLHPTRPRRPGRHWLALFSRPMATIIGLNLNIAEKPGCAKSFPCKPQGISRRVGLGVS